MFTLVAGHVPHGECPTVVRTGDVTLVTADTSYSQMGHTSRWGVDNRGKAVSEVVVYADGRAEVEGGLSDGREVAYTLAVGRSRACLVGEPLADGWWVKGQIKGGAEDGKYLTCKGEGFKVSMEVKTAAEVEASLLVPLHDPVQPTPPKPGSSKAPSGAPKRVGYVTDVEGNLDYFASYVQRSKVLKWKEGTVDEATAWREETFCAPEAQLDFRDQESAFVFGGDSPVIWSGGWHGPCA